MNDATAVLNDSGDVPFRKRTHTLASAIGELRILGSRRAEIRAIWGAHRVSPDFRELIMHAVAETNECRYCAYVHHELAVAEGASPNEDGGDDQYVAAALAWARARAEESLGEVQGPLEQQLEALIGAEALKDLDTVVRMMHFFNLAGNNMDALFERLRGRDVPGQLIADVVIGGLYALGVVPVTILSGLRSGRGPIASIRGMRSFELTPQQRHLTPVASEVAS